MHKAPVSIPKLTGRHLNPSGLSVKDKWLTAVIGAPGPVEGWLSGAVTDQSAVRAVRDTPGRYPALPTTTRPTPGAASDMQTV